jgi:threonine dehydrogenase-like Zn-dependent dehydrogenase
MKAVVFHGVGDIRLDDVPEPKIEDARDAIVRITASALCGTDLHMVRGTVGEMVPGTILGHEGVGIVEEIGSEVRNINIGDRVVISPSIACGYCSYCRAGYFSQCDNANPHGKLAGTAYFGGPKETGPFNGMQAEFVRVPFANVGLTKLPEDVDDDQALMISDIFATGYYGAEIAEIAPGDTVAVFGCGPVGQFAIASAILMRAGRVLAVDHVPSRLEMARAQGAETINFDEEDPVDMIRSLTGGIGTDRVIDAVGVDAERPESGPAAQEDEQGLSKQELVEERKRITGKQMQEGMAFKPGNAPSQALDWEVKSIAKAGTLAIIGVYPQNMHLFPIGMAMNKNLTMNMGNCPHHAYIPMLVDLVETGAFDPQTVLTQLQPLSSAIEAYQSFSAREPGWMKVELVPLEAANKMGVR